MNRARSVPNPAEVLVVEDNRPDARMIVDILLDGRVPKHVTVVSGGDEALSFLHRRDPHANAPRPALVVLDLNMPGRDGREVLSAIKGDPALQRIPVVVLTTSDAPSDVNQAYELRANAYVVKPVGLDAFTEVIRSLEHFWLAIAQQPDPEEAA